MYKVISMYTKNTPYEEEIKELGHSCDQFKVDYKFYPIVNLKDWVKNTQQKAAVIHEALDEFECDLVWLDADAVILKKLELFDKLANDNDFHLYIHRAYHLPLKIDNDGVLSFIRRNISNFLKRRKHPKGEVISNSIYIKNCAKTKELVSKWVALNEHKIEWDQRNLQEIIDAGDSDYVVKQLPKEYARILPKGNQLETLNDGNNYIGQKQASRSYRKTIHNF